MAQDITQVTDHEARAERKLAQQYRGKTNFQRVLRVISRQVQEIEDVLFQILQGYRLSTPPVGDQLDVLGRVVGQAREGADDAEYRLRIAAKIRANLSTGTAEDLLTVFGILLPTHTLEIWEAYPAQFFMEAVEPLTDLNLLPLYQRFFAATKAAGVAGQFYYAVDPVAETLTLDDSTSPTPDPDLGLGDEGDPDVGGGLVGVFAA